MLYYIDIWNNHITFGGQSAILDKMSIQYYLDILVFDRTVANLIVQSKQYLVNQPRHQHCLIQIRDFGIYGNIYITESNRQLLTLIPIHLNS